jgi:hypothetical protein
MIDIFKSQTCILIENLDELEDILQNDIDFKNCFFFCTHYDLSNHYYFSKKFKIEYSDNCSLIEFIKEKNIQILIFSKLNLETIKKSEFISDIYKNKIEKIGFFSKNSHEFIFSENFYQIEKDDKDYWKWNFGDSLMSSLQIINYFPFGSTYTCNIRWPFLIEKDSSDSFSNRLIDNENNFAENRENKDLYYSCDGFSKKNINFYFDKKKNYELDPRNLNFSLHNFKINKYELETNLLNKVNLYNGLIKNLYNKIQIFNLNDIFKPIIEIIAYRNVDNFNLKILDRDRFERIEQNRMISKNNLLIFNK